MLTIRKEQLHILGAFSRDRHIDRIVELLRQHWPGRCSTLGAEALRAQVAAIVAEAEQFGISHQSDLMRYANLSFLWGPHFVNDASFGDAAAILRSGSLAGPVKIQLLLDLARDMMPLE
jgi:hypothetical protein